MDRPVTPSGVDTALSDRVEATGGVGLRVVVRPGTEDRPGFLLVHGLASNARMWDGVGRLLSLAGHRSVAVDQRGHGESDKPDDGYDTDTFVADLMAIIGATVERPVVAVGQSWGGNVVMELAARHPEAVAAVGCIDGGFIDLRATFGEWSAAATVLAPPDFDGLTIDRLRQRAARHYQGWPASGVEAQLANFATTPEGTVRPKLSRDRHMRILRDMWDRRPADTAGRVGVPVLVLATTDQVEGKREAVEAFAGALRQGEVVWMDAHHDVHAQQPDVVSDLLVSLAGRSR